MTTVDMPPVAGDLTHRSVPHATAAEQVVLGAMMLSPRSADEVIEHLVTRDFYDQRHAAIYAAVIAQYGVDAPADPVALADVLERDGKLARVGGFPYLHDLVNAVPTVASAGYYAKIVAEKAALRRIAEAGARIAEIGYGSEAAGRDAASAADLAQQAVHEATAANVNADLGPVSGWSGSVVDHLEAVAEGRAPRGVSTGLGSLDKLVGGMLGGQLWIPAGRPGMGKSTVAVGLAKAAARRDLPAFVFSVEMSRQELMWRILSDVASVDLKKFTTGSLNRVDLAKVRDAQKVIDGWPLHVYDTFRNVSSIRAASRRLTQRYGKPAVVVVDFLQRLASDRRDIRRDQEVGEHARLLKTLAQEIDTTVVAPSQLNRGSEARTDKRPQLADLRESGELEQEADIVILLHRDDYYDKEHERAGEADFIVAKHRNGPTDTVTVAAQLHYSRFTDWDAPEEPYR